MAIFIFFSIIYSTLEVNDINLIWDSNGYVNIKDKKLDEIEFFVNKLVGLQNNLKETLKFKDKLKDFIQEYENSMEKDYGSNPNTTKDKSFVSIFLKKFDINDSRFPLKILFTKSEALNSSLSRSQRNGTKYFHRQSLLIESMHNTFNFVYKEFSDFSQNRQNISLEDNIKCLNITKVFLQDFEKGLKVLFTFYFEFIYKKFSDESCYKLICNKLKERTDTLIKYEEEQKSSSITQSDSEEKMYLCNNCYKYFQLKAMWNFISFNRNEMELNEDQIKNISDFLEADKKRCKCMSKFFRVYLKLFKGRDMIQYQREIFLRSVQKLKDGLVQNFDSQKCLFISEVNQLNFIDLLDEDLNTRTLFTSPNEIKNLYNLLTNFTAELIFTHLRYYFNLCCIKTIIETQMTAAQKLIYLLKRNENIEKLRLIIEILSEFFEKRKDFKGLNNKVDMFFINYFIKCNELDSFYNNELINMFKDLSVN